MSRIKRWYLDLRLRYLAYRLGVQLGLSKRCSYQASVEVMKMLQTFKKNHGVEWI